MRLDAAISRLQRERRRLDAAQGRIARRNARRAVIGALRSVRAMLDAEYPAIVKPAIVRDAVTVAAESMHWRAFEYDIIAHIRIDWSLELAEAFNARCAQVFGLTPKPIRIVDLRGGYLGLHGVSEIQLAPGMSRENKWRTLMHEIAHYRVAHHRRAFVQELATVYRLWKEFRQEST